MVNNELGACEWFVWDLRRSGLIERGQLDTIVSDYLRNHPRAEAQDLAEHLVQQGLLTPFQAERILQGKCQGLVLGPYVLLEAVGSGSMGQVYRAASKNDNNYYAVKVLPRRSMWNVRLARRQVRAFQNFQHPTVVPFLDVGTAGGLHYLVWPFVDGTPLEQIVQNQGPLPVPLAVLYGVQIAQGLDICHQNNVFHGLIKPSNIMIGTNNQVHILDFGIGSLLAENEGESLVDTMSTANTLTSGLDCASPESILDPSNRTAAGDQYSLGCVLYFCLTGRVPFPEGSAVEKMMAHQTKQPTPIRQLAPHIPAELEAVIMRLMAKKPEERYGSCEDVVEALQPFLGELRAIPGGVPLQFANGGRAGGGNLLQQSSGRLAGIGSRATRSPGLSGERQSPEAATFTTPPPMAGHTPGRLPSTAPSPPQPATGMQPGTRLTPPGSGPQSGERTMGVPPASTPLSPTAGPVRPLPVGFARASTVGLPPLPPPPATAAPLAGRPSAPLLPTRSAIHLAASPSGHTGSSAWAEEIHDRPSNRFGPLGVACAALLLMVVVYLGTVLLLKQ